MRRRGDRGLTDLSSFVSAVIPRDAAKHLERALNCSPRTARTIIEGQVPGRLRSALIALLKSTIEARKTQLQRVEDEIRQIEYAEMVARSVARRAEGDPSAAAASAGSDIRQ